MATTFSGEQAIEALYVGYFGRAGDPSGTNYWVGQLNSGMSITQIAASFSVQPESTALYSYLANPNIGNGAAITNFIDQVYQDLFNRAPDSAGLAYWTAQLQAANGSPQAVAQFILNVITGAQGVDQTIIQNKVAVAQFFTDQLVLANGSYNAQAGTVAHSTVQATTDDPATVTAQDAAITTFIQGTSNGVTFTLTTAIDNIQGTTGGDTFIGDNSGTTLTVSAADSVAGGGGIDTFNYFLGVAATAVVPQLNGVEVVNLIGGAPGHAANFSSAVGLTNLNVKNNTSGFDSYTVGAGVSVGLDNVVAAANEQFIVSATQTSATLNLMNGTKITGGGTVSVDGAALTTINVNSTGAANTIDFLSSTGNETTIKIGGDKGLTITNAFAATVNTVDGSTDTGGFKVKLGTTTAATTVTGGSGADTVDTTNVGAQVLTVNLGAGADTLNVGGQLATYASGTVLDGGDATGNIIAITNGATLTATTAAEIKNFQILDVSGGTGTYNSTLGGFTADQANHALNGNFGAVAFSKVASTGFVFSDLAAKGVNTADTSLDVQLATATGATDSATINLTAVDGNNDATANGLVNLGTLQFTTGGVENLTINSTVSGIDTGLTALNYNNTIGTLIDASSGGTDKGLVTLTITGNAGFNLTTALSAATAANLTKIDASGETGVIDVTNFLDYHNAANSVSYIGSAATDWAIAGSKGTVFTGNAGNDQLTLAADAAGRAASTLVFKAASDTTEYLDGAGKLSLGTNSATLPGIENYNNFLTTSQAAANGFASTHDTIDISTIGGFTGYAKGVATVASVNPIGSIAGSVTNFFNDGGGNRGVAVDYFGGDAYVFVDTNHDGNFTANTDLVVKLAGVTNLTANDINFG